MALPEVSPYNKVRRAKKHALQTLGVLASDGAAAAIGP
jgi:hypothetical protein